MLSNEHRAIVKATAPLLESGGEALITHFYKAMLDEYPEVRPLFNQTHQASGAQPRALANGVLMYARHIDRLDQLGGLVEQIGMSRCRFCPSITQSSGAACFGRSAKCSVRKSRPMRCSKRGAPPISNWPTS
jgi:hemoglobin-like flavoprotein